jgi:hypothetical protein
MSERNSDPTRHVRWARLFTLAGWDWKLASTPGFDFQVTMPCGHSECNGSHELLIRLCHDQSPEMLEKDHDSSFTVDEMYDSPHPALFGNGPDNTHWQMAHGAGGGYARLGDWPGMTDLWERAAHE